ncbi:MAG: hypothetical protein ABSA12_16085 [Verrucomicrobiia bacterium]|jgi:hypothetical protein
MKDFEATVFDIFAYLVPGATCAAAVVVPLSLCGVIPFPDLTIGDAIVSTLLFYVAGVLCSALRPRRFADSITGTTEDAYEVALTDEHLRGCFAVAAKHFFGEAIDPKTWNKERHFAVRFFVEQRHKATGDFIRRQSAIRQLRYNIVVPVLLLTLGMTCTFVVWILKGTVPIWIGLAGAASTGLCGATVIRAIYTAARGNIHREVLYVMSAVVALYWVGKIESALPQAADGNKHASAS